MSKPTPFGITAYALNASLIFLDILVCSDKYHVRRNEGSGSSLQAASSLTQQLGKTLNILRGELAITLQHY